MHELRLGEQRPAALQRLDDGGVGVAFLAVGLHDPLAGE